MSAPAASVDSDLQSAADQLRSVLDSAAAARIKQGESYMDAPFKAIKIIKCSLHGSYFDLESGTALVDPADEPIGTYPVKIEAGRIWIDPS
jgi:nitrite reductase/ring-hydroxylating ferredoxin subunit